MALSEADDLSTLLTSWVASTPPITVASTQLQVDTTCPVVIDALEADACSVDPPTDLPTNVTMITILVDFVVLLALFL